ncbi:MAG TPA: hypothetical protein VGE57_12160 [Solimonas sp.]
MGEAPAIPEASCTAKEPPSSTPPPTSGGGGGGGAGWRWLLWGIGAVGAVVIGGLLGYWALMNLSLKLVLKNQPGMVTLPPEFDATASVTNVLDIIMKGTIKAKVPFKQTLDLPLQGRYNTEVELDTVVPVKFTVTYDGTIPVNTIADITARANFNFQDVKGFRQLDVKAKLPMKFNLPVRLVAPVDTGLRFAYHGPMMMGLDQTLRADVDTMIDTRLDVNQRVSAPVTADIPLRVRAPTHPLKAIITEADLAVRLDSLRLGVTEDASAPQRADSPWGPQPTAPAARAP